jgi:hypothetical protein
MLHRLFAESCRISFLLVLGPLVSASSKAAILVPSRVQPSHSISKHILLMPLHPSLLTSQSYRSECCLSNHHSFLYFPLAVSHSSYWGYCGLADFCCFLLAHCTIIIIATVKTFSLSLSLILKKNYWLVAQNK